MLRILRSVFQYTSPTAFFALCVVYGITYFAVQLYFGMNGHRIGWRNRHFSGGLDEYFKVQRAWMWWGFGINISLGVVLPALLVLGLLNLGMSGAHARRMQHRSWNGAGGYSQSGYSQSGYPPNGYAPPAPGTYSGGAADSGYSSSP